MTSSFNALRSSDLFYAPQFETAERTIRSWSMFDGEIWNEVIGLFRKIWRATKKFFKKLICSRQEKSLIDHRIRYVFADLQSGKSGLALLLCVYNYMWSKKKGLQPVNIIGSCSQLARIPEQFKSDLQNVAKFLDCHPDSILPINNIVANGSWKKTSDIDIHNTEGKSVLLITDEAHMASEKENQFYKKHREFYEAKKENSDRYPNFHILGISATPNEVFCALQSELKRGHKASYSFDVMLPGTGHLNIEGLRTNGRLPYYGEKNYSTWDNVPNNQIEAIAYELRKVKDYQKAGKNIFITRCNSTQFEKIKKAHPNIVYRSYMSNTKDSDTYPVDQLIPDMEKLQNDGKIYCLRIDQSHTEGCRMGGRANSKVIAVFDSEKVTLDHTVVQHIGRWCGYNKSHYDFPIYTHNNNNAISNYMKLTKGLQNCSQSSNEIEEFLKNANIEIKTKNTTNKRPNYRKVLTLPRDEEVSTEKYRELFEVTNGLTLSEEDRAEIEELRGDKQPLSDKNFFRPDCPKHNLSARINSNGFQEVQLLMNLFRYNGKTYTKDIVNSESLGGIQYEFDPDKRAIDIRNWKENLQKVSENYNNSNLTAQPDTKNSDETQRYIKDILSTKNLIKTEIPHGKSYRNKIIFEDCFLLAERFVDGIKYGKKTVGRTKGSKITRTLVRFKKDDKNDYNKKGEYEITKFIEDNQSKTRIELIIEVAILIRGMNIQAAQDMTKYILQNHPYLLTEKLVLVKDFTADFGKDINEKSIFHCNLKDEETNEL
jgi:hypothetical protein